MAHRKTTNLSQIKQLQTDIRMQEDKIALLAAGCLTEAKRYLDELREKLRELN